MDSLDDPRERERERISWRSRVDEAMQQLAWDRGGEEGIIAEGELIEALDKRDFTKIEEWRSGRIAVPLDDRLMKCCSMTVRTRLGIRLET